MLKPKSFPSGSPAYSVSRLQHVSSTNICPARFPKSSSSSSSSVIPASHRSLAQLRPETPSELWFSPSINVAISPSSSRAWEGLNGGEENDHKPPDERIIKLGRTLRILSSHLPNILINPLPQEILSPSISLHLFPSTHPHLPTVKGRVPYRAALWTAPVAWGSVPIVGNVKLQIQSERMARSPSIVEFGQSHAYGDEKLVVRWRTEGRGKSDTATTTSTGTRDASTQAASSEYKSASSNGVNRGLSMLLGGDAPIFKLGKEEQFSGLFIFCFDKEGRIASHTIEHADESNGWDRTAKVVTLTDWLLGKAKWGSGSEPEPAFMVGVDSDGQDRSIGRR